MVSLGAVTLLKEEDAGEVYADDDVKVPDYSIVLRDGRRLLVEVKNHYQDEPFDDPLAFKAAYIHGMRRYAELMKCPLRFAVFWARWNIWTLVAPEVFTARGEDYVLTLGEAMTTNDMAILGDKSIGTTFPLRMRVVADPTKPRTVGPDGQVRFTIGGIKLLSKDTEITDPVEQHIAWYLMLYGGWQSEGSPEAKIVDGQFEYAEMVLMPIEDNRQGFEIIGSLSGMYSAFYRERTAPNGRIEQVRLEAVPRKLAELVPDGYRGKVLGLWIFILQPSHPLVEATDLPA